MTFTPKDWKNSPDSTTPLSAAALEDMETRVTDYADTVGTAANAYADAVGVAAGTAANAYADAVGVAAGTAANAYADAVKVTTTLSLAGIETSGTATTTAGTLTNVPNMGTSIVLPTTSHIVAMASAELESSTAQASTIGVALNVDGTDHLEHARYLSGSNDKGVAAITHFFPDTYAAGTVDITLRFRRVSGSGTPGINNASIAAIGIPHEE